MIKPLLWRKLPNAMMMIMMMIDVDDLWQTVQPGPVSEKQAQWFMLQFCPVTLGVGNRVDKV